MAGLDVLVMTQPGPDDGALIPSAHSVVPQGSDPANWGPWRFVIEIAAVDPTATAWSLAEWGPDDDSGAAVWENDDIGYDWVDVTGDVRGLEWRRGADEPYGRTRTGTATLVIDNRTNRYSPWADDPVGPFVAAQYVLGPGTVIRWGYRRRYLPNDNDFHQTWRPQFTGRVEFWDTETDGVDRSRWATIQLVETVAMIAGIDEPERPAVGADEHVDARIARLLEPTETGWPFGIVTANPFEPYSLVPLQATTMAGNRIAECYITADSVSGVLAIEFAADRFGRATVREVATAIHPVWDRPSSGFFGFIPAQIAVFAPTPAIATGDAALLPDGRAPVVAQYPADALRRRAGNDTIINWVSIAAAGGTATVAEDPGSRVENGRRTFTRHDLICQPTESVPREQAHRIIDERAANHPQVQPFTILAGRTPGSFDVVTITDAQDSAVVFGHSPTVALHCRVRAITHRIRPHQHAGHRHTATFELDTIAELEVK